MAARQGHQAGEAYLQWLRAGALAVGLGAAITAGQGVAVATPSDSPDPQPASATSEAGNTPDAVEGGAAGADAGSPGGSASGEASPGPSVDGPSSTVSAQQNTNADPDAEGEPDPTDGGALGEDTETGLVPDTTTVPEPTIEPVEAGDVDTTPGSGSVGAVEAALPLPDAGGTTADQPARVREPDGSNLPAPRAALATQTGPADTAADVTVKQVSGSSTVSSVAAEIASAPTGLAPVDTPPAPAAKSVTIAATPPATAAAVTLNSIVTDLLSWIGWGSLATGLPFPVVPLPTLVESMWLVLRQTQYVIAPVSVSYLTGQTTGPAPEAAAAATESADAGLDPAALADLLARPDVSVSLNSDGTVDVIDGRFTDATVNSSADAARLLNELAPLLGASTGFANLDNISVQLVGQTGAPTAETFYRLRDTVNGVPVVGSEVILVTNASGTVTGLFNNHDRRLGSIDMTPDARIDEYAEAVLAATAAYLVSAIAKPYLWVTLPFMAFSSFDPELMVYSLDPEAPPQLAWRVAIDPFDPLEVLGLTMVQPGSTYYIDANGADTGTVLLASSPQDFFDPATTTAGDVLGQLRDVNVARLDLLLFNVDLFSDVSRNIATSQFIGVLLPFRFIQGILPVLGAIPVFTGIPLLSAIPFITALPYMDVVLGGPNPSAVSAQANMAAVYDYYKDELGLISFDGVGAPINVVVEYNPFGPLGGLIEPFVNAFWDPSNQMLVFGDGGELEGALDVVGHEYTHAVVSHILGESALATGESGALNEAYADILGNLIEGKTDEGRWLLGEDSTIGELRDMKDPSRLSTRFGEYPDHYDERYIGTEDGGGVHINATIFTHAAYLMMTAEATQDISDETWAGVFYQSICRLSADAQFVDARAAILDTLSTFDFTSAQRGAVEQAFNDVGIEGS